MLLSVSLIGAAQRPVPPTQEIVTAVNTQRIEQLERETSQHGADIQAMAREVSGLKSSIDRFTGIGIGIGVTLTVIQGMQLILTYRKGK